MSKWDIITENKRGKLVVFAKFPTKVYYIRHNEKISFVLKKLVLEENKKGGDIKKTNKLTSKQFYNLL